MHCYVCGIPISNLNLAFNDKGIAIYRFELHTSLQFIYRRKPIKRTDNRDKRGDNMSFTNPY